MPSPGRSLVNHCYCYGVTNTYTLRLLLYAKAFMMSTKFNELQLSEHKGNASHSFTVYHLKFLHMFPLKHG